MTDTALLLSRYQLKNWLACQRRFQLRYITRQTWPAAPISPDTSGLFEQGKQFHRLLEQHYLGFDVRPPTSNANLTAWWRNFQAHPPTLPNTPDLVLHPERTISVPIGAHFLSGRYDLLALTQRAVQIIDWKTERNPRSADQLAADWQTRLYLAMIAEGGNALGRVYAPEQITLTYWFAQQPERSVTLQYDTAQHTRNWAELNEIVERIGRRLAAPNAIWPLTEQWSHCERCAYQALCGRVQSRTITETNMEEMDEAEMAYEEAERLIFEPIEP